MLGNESYTATINFELTFPDKWLLIPLLHLLPLEDKGFLNTLNEQTAMPLSRNSFSSTYFS